MAEAKQKWSFSGWIRPLLNVNFILILLIQSINGLTGQMIASPVTPMAKALGISSFVIGMCTSLYTGFTILARPCTGVGMDRMSKQKLIIWAFVLKAGVSVLYAFTNNVYVYAISRAVQGFVFAILSTALPAATTAAVDKKSLGTALGLFLAVPKLIEAWGTKLVQMLYNTYGFRTAYLVTAVVTLSPIILVLFVKFDESMRVEVKKKNFNIFRGISVKALPLCVMSFFIMIGQYANSNFRLVFMEERGVDVATAIGIASSLSIITRLIGGFVADRWGAKWVVIPSFVMCAASMFLLAGCNSFAVCVAACIFWSLGIGMYLPALQSQVFGAVPASERGAASATWFMCMDVTGLIFTPILGLICDWSSYSACFIFAGICIVLGIIYYLTVGQRIMRKALDNSAAE